MKRINRAKYIAVVAVLALSLSGCPKGGYHTAVVAEHDFTTALNSFQQAEIVEAHAGRIDPVEHQKIEAGIARIATAGQTLVISLQSGVANTTVQQNFATVSSAIVDLMNSGVLGIKNPTSQALLQLSLSTAQAILANVGQLLTAPTTPMSTAPAVKGAQ